MKNFVTRGVIAFVLAAVSVSGTVIATDLPTGGNIGGFTPVLNPLAGPQPGSCTSASQTCQK